MATASKNFVALTAAAGSVLGANGAVLAIAPGAAASMATALTGTILDKFTLDASGDGFTKHGAVILALAVSTPQTIDLTALTGTTAGDTAFATWNRITFLNLAANPVIVSPGASNPLRNPLAGTTPTLTIPGSARGLWDNPAGSVVDSTHKTLTFDPGAALCTIAVIVSGA